jgi:hypothetical protein
MLKYAVLWSVTIGLCLGGSCTITIPGDGTSRTYLDQTDADIEISQVVGAAQADVTATITDSLGRAVNLTSGQSVKINDVALRGPSVSGKFTVDVDAAGEYVISVDEPTRGVEHTTVVAPAEFAITSPAEGGGASLSGFTLKWSPADERYQVKMTFSQTIFGSTQAVDFGPFTDTGSRAFTADDLKEFVQGAGLTISVTRIHTVVNVAGFNSGTATAGVTTTAAASPRP